MGHYCSGSREAAIVLPVAGVRFWFRELPRLIPSYCSNASASDALGCVESCFFTRSLAGGEIRSDKGVFISFLILPAEPQHAELPFELKAQPFRVVGKPVWLFVDSNALPESCAAWPDVCSSAKNGSGWYAWFCREFLHLCLLPTFFALKQRIQSPGSPLVHCWRSIQSVGPFGTLISITWAVSMSWTRSTMLCSLPASSQFKGD
jgi:hypothetical protein